MLTEILVIITTGVAIVEGVTRIMKNYKDLLVDDFKKDTEETIQEVEQRIAVMENEINKPQQDEEKISEAYIQLIKILQENKDYLEYIRIIPTDYGTFKIVRRRKKTILRDPQGEY